MGLRWKPKLKRSVVWNAGALIPLVYDAFMKRRAGVVGHPGRRRELHRMRIDGKPLRYALETYEVCFGPGYRACFEEVKEMLELMGAIHDLDVAVDRLRGFLREMRTLNRVSGNKVRTGALVRLITEQAKLRDTAYREFCERIDVWNSEDFRGRLIRELLPVTPPVAPPALSGRSPSPRTRRTVR